MSRYKVHVTPRALREIKNLPGNMRQRVKRAVGKLADHPHPANSKVLNVTNLEMELCRLRLDNWRVVYMRAEVEKTVDVLAVRKRPPYDYGDLTNLLDEII